MKTAIVPMPGALWPQVKFQALALALAGITMIGSRIRDAALESFADALGSGSRESEKPAPGGTGTGEVGSPNNDEEGKPEKNKPQAGTDGNPRRCLGHNYRPVLWMPQVDLPLVAEIVRLEGESRDAELAGNPREAARCHLLAVALTHSMARLACTGPENLEAMRHQLAEDVDSIGEQVTDSMRGDTPAEIATGYQLDQSAHLYALAMLRKEGGRHA